MIPARFDHRADHEHIGRVLAEKLRRRTDRERGEQGFWVVQGERVSL